MTSIFKYLFPTLAVLAVAGLQVFGVQRGYVCDHQEQAVSTTAEHCHSAEVGVVPCTSDKGCDTQENGGDREHHEPIVVKLNVSKASFSAHTIPPYIAVMVAELPSLVSLRLLVLSELSINNVPPDTGRDRPPAAVQVARCMVMLI